MVTCKDLHCVLDILLDNTKFIKNGLDNVSIAYDGGFIYIHCRKWVEGGLVQLYLVICFGLAEFQVFSKFLEFLAAMGDNDLENAVNDTIVKEFGLLSIVKDIADGQGGCMLCTSLKIMEIQIIFRSSPE